MWHTNQLHKTLSKNVVRNTVLQYCKIVHDWEVDLLLHELGASVLAVCKSRDFSVSMFAVMQTDLLLHELGASVFAVCGSHDFSLLMFAGM